MVGIFRTDWKAATTAIATMAIGAASFGAEGSVRPVSCPCNRGGTAGPTGGYGSPYAVPVAPAPAPGTHAPYGFPSDIDRPLPPMSSPLGDVPPPPGTLGQTYARPSRPIPVEKHPRVGMIDVRIVGAARVAVRGTNNFRTEDKLDGFRDINDPNLWHFESKPLLPGLPHIYRVEATIGEPGAERLEVRYVRLIMGRIVDLTY